MSVSITVAELTEYVRSGWFSYILSFKNDRFHALCSLILTYYLNIIASAVIVVLIISFYDYHILSQLLRILITMVIISGMVFSALVLLYVVSGRYVCFTLLIPIMSMIGCILIYITIAHPSVDYVNDLSICMLLVVSILGYVFSFLQVHGTDFQ